MPWEMSVSIHTDEETEAPALLGAPGCLRAQPTQAILPYQSVRALPKTGCETASLTLSSAISPTRKLQMGTGWHPDSSGCRPWGHELGKLGCWLPALAKQPGEED